MMIAIEMYKENKVSFSYIISFHKVNSVAMLFILPAYSVRNHGVTKSSGSMWFIRKKVLSRGSKYLKSRRKRRNIACKGLKCWSANIVGRQICKNDLKYKYTICKGSPSLAIMINGATISFIPCL